MFKYRLKSGEAHRRPFDLYFVSTHSSDRLWGGERSLLAIAQNYPVGSTTTLRLVCGDGALADAWDDLKPPRARRSTRLRLADAGRAVAMWRILTWAPRARRESIIVAFDLITVPPLVLLRPLFHAKGIKLVVDLHDHPERHQRMFIPIWISRYADRVVAVSTFVAQQVPSRVPSSVVARPIQTTAQVEPRSSPALRVGIVGRIDPEKRIEDGIAIAKCAQQNGVDLELILRGAPSYGGDVYLREMLSRGRSALQDHFTFEGSVPSADALANIDVLLFLNPTEPSGRVVAEAQMAGVPVIAPDAGGVSEFIISGETGLIFRSGDIEHAAHVLGTLRDSLIRGDISKKARSYALTEYAPSKQAAKYARAVAGR